MSRLPARLDIAEVQQALREVWAVLDPLLTRNLELKGRRVTGAGHSVEPQDYVNRYELERDYSFDKFREMMKKEGLEWNKTKIIKPDTKDKSPSVRGIKVTNINNPVELNVLSGKVGDLVVCQQEDPAAIQDSYVIYGYDDSGPVVDAPYVMDAPGSGGWERWIALVGNYSILPLLIKAIVQINGSLGINVVPSASLSIKGGTLAGMIHLGQLAGASNTWSGICCNAGSGPVSTSNYAIIGSALHTTVGRPSGGNLYFAENNAAQMMIEAGGAVGINTITPDAKLAINGGLHVGGDSDPGDNNAEVDGNIVVGGTVDTIDVAAHTHSAAAGHGVNIPQASVTNLVSDLGGKAGKASITGATIPLRKINDITGSDGSITVNADGIVTGYTAPT